ncbi:cucumber peeling cupredoxin-like [Coffea eugenioides]|uniref:cucumber peeling cupredoxin-like n=1 Tax=Coffea eugenioides TaxID=49369 RepID=UPI000F6046C3|nr:cucumber peeling cupredoxin-like [Coffea eugenioides]
MPTRLLISPAFIILPSLLIQSFGLEYIVGDSFWSIPTTNDFYTNWSSSHFFQTGDTLYFDFDSGLHNVMEVSRREYESCSADNPFKVLWDGPASVALMEEGQKLSVAVHSEKNSPHSAPTSSQRPPKSSQPSPDASKMPPPAMTPYSSQAPTSMTDLSVSLVTVKSAGDQCCNDAIRGPYSPQREDVPGEMALSCKQIEQPEAVLAPSGFLA